MSSRAMNIEQVIQQLEAEIAKLQQVHVVLTGGQVKGAITIKARRRRRKMSAAAKARIAAAQRARWARVKAALKKT